MRKPQILNSANRALHLAGLKVKKHSPAILIGVGVVGVVTSTVMACKATLKVNEILEENKKNVEAIHHCAEDQELIESGRYTEKDVKKDLTIAYAQTGVKLVKLYGPAVAVGGLSIASILASYKILNARNVAISAAYTVVDKSFKDYRNRVKERFGEKVDRELKYNIKAKTIETLEVNENGEEVTETKNIEVSVLDQYSEFARYFDEGSKYWSKSAEYNLTFLRQREKWANEKLQADGFLYLNEVYECLGIPKTKAGQQVGWVYSKDNAVGDNFVSFGIYDLYKESARDFVNGYEKVILLDFNVDGNILDLMP